jgi:hypothetical protein
MVGKDWIVLEGTGTTNSMIELYYFQTDVNRDSPVIDSIINHQLVSVDFRGGRCLYQRF